jgi:hypothetical protein
MSKFQSFFLEISLLILSIILTYHLDYGFATQEQSLDKSTAESVFNNESLTLPQNTGSFIILIPNEAHESWQDEKHKLLTVKNPYFLPTELIIPTGASISFLNADAPWDTPHPHTINLEDSSGKIVYSSENMEYGDSSEPINLTAGNYSVMDTKYDWMKGSLVVTNQNSTGNNVVGGFYTPTKQAKNNQDNDGVTHPGSLDYYRGEFSKNGFEILSEYNFNYNACDYCDGKYWPDNKTGEHTLIIFSTSQPLSQALVTLEKLVIDNVYV